MKQPGRDDRSLENEITAVRGREAPADVAQGAAKRVWERLAREASPLAGPVTVIGGCSDVRALLPAHREGTLSGARALLIDDHLRECATCRAAFRQPGVPRLAVLPWRPATPAASPEPRNWRQHLVAASVLLAVGLSAWGVRQAFFAVPPGSRATVQSVSGVLQNVGADRTQGLTPGQQFGEGEVVRTARGSQAFLRLRDGSVVEMGERAELSVAMRGADTTIRLERGGIIVQAAKRRTGRLLVSSKDCTVQVTGTVFSVSRGLKGSRVSVIEGHVRVSQSGADRQLEPGDQWASSASMGALPLREEIAWSRDLDQHLALMGEFKVLRAKWDAVRTPGLRYESRLLRSVPEGAVLFASLPNYGEALADAHRLFEERLQESAVLREWWSQADPVRHGGPGLAAVIDRVRGFADYLGDEVAFAALVDAHGQASPVLLAEVRRQGLREFIEGELRGLEAQADHKHAVRILDEAAPAPGVETGTGLYVLLRPDLIAVSGSAEVLRAVSKQQAVSGLSGTSFGQRITEAYGNGVGLLFAANLDEITRISRARTGASESAKLRGAGVDGLRYLIVERKGLLGESHTAASLGFSGPRHGIASWLAAPAPMGSLDFVSPNAGAVAAFVVKSPSLLLDDVLGMAKGGENPARAGHGLAELESKLDLRIREDIVETLGGELALALDGPLLPTPAWKLVVEVYDPNRLQASLQVIVSKANDEAAQAGRPGIRLEAEQTGGQTYHALRGLPIEVHYAFVDGYLVAAPSRALVMRALHTRETGESLGRSASFRSLFPPDRQAHVSGLAYQNFGPVVGPLLGAADLAGLSTDQRQALEVLARDTKPTLVCAYGDDNGIRVAGSGGLLDLDPTNLALPMLLSRAVPGTGAKAFP